MLENAENQTEAQETSAINEIVTDQYCQMANVHGVRKNLTLMMLRDVHNNPNDYTTEDVEDLATTLYYLEDIE